MSAPSRRELLRTLRTSTIVPSPLPAVWSLDWIDVSRLVDAAGWRLAIWFVSSAEGELPPGLSIDDFSVETASGGLAPGWRLSDLDADSNPVTLLLDRSPSAGPWTEPSLVVVYSGELDLDDGVSVDPLSDRHEIFLSPPVVPESDTRELAPFVDEQAIGDYKATRSGLLHRLALTAPEWQERSEADPWMVLVDLLAWAGDQLSGYQDAVATEAWLETARQRLSVRRHARLLGFTAHDGCNSRAWLRVSPAGEIELEAGTRFATKSEPDLREPGVRNFRSLTSERLSPELEALRLYSWGLADWTLPLGATTLALVGEAPGLKAGSVLSFPGEHLARISHLQREKDPVTGERITRVELFADDALPVALSTAETTVSANLVLVSDGVSFTFTEPPDSSASGSLLFRLRGRRIAFVEPFDAQRARRGAASRALRQDPERAVADLDVLERRPGGVALRWEVRRDLLHSGPYDRHVVAELGEDELVLRFGDGVNGRPAPSPSLLVVVGREVGTSKEAAHPGTRLFTLDAPESILDVQLFVEVEPVDALRSSHVRLSAPRAARISSVCRVAEDYAKKVRRLEGVLDAHAEIRWTGSWYTVYVWVLPIASDDLDPALAAEIWSQLEPVRMLGVDLDIRAPRYVVGDIALVVQLEPGAARASVEKALRSRLGAGDFFARNAWMLGGSVSQGAVVAAACRVRGVRDVRVERFRREDEPAETVGDWITVGLEEVVRVGVGGAAAVALQLDGA